MWKLKHFNPRFPWGKRQEEFCLLQPPSHFNPRFPWGKRPAPVIFSYSFENISIHASRGGSDGYCNYAIVGGEGISIHASRGGSDGRPWLGYANCHISIHASRGGSDQNIVAGFDFLPVFQSTLPVGEATGKS